MKAISQYLKLRYDVLELMDLIRGKFNVVDQIEDVIHCKMRNKTGCLGSSCMYFKFVPINPVDGENRCYFFPKSASNRCNSSDQYILLATLKLESYKQVEELILTLSKKIPEHVERFRFRDKCEFDSIEINPITKDIIVVWVRDKYEYSRDSDYYEENIHECDKTLQDEKMSRFEAFKRGEFL